jgi:hypothetical protein
MPLPAPVTIATSIVDTLVLLILLLGESSQGANHSELYYNHPC